MDISFWKNLTCLVLISASVSNLIVFSKIFKPLRLLVSPENKPKIIRHVFILLDGIFNCTKCFGFWFGLGISFALPVVPIEYFGRLLDGFIASSTSYLWSSYLVSLGAEEETETIKNTESEK